MSCPCSLMRWRSLTTISILVSTAYPVQKALPLQPTPIVTEPVSEYIAVTRELLEALHTFCRGLYVHIWVFLRYIGHNPFYPSHLEMPSLHLCPSPCSMGLTVLAHLCTADIHTWTNLHTEEEILQGFGILATGYPFQSTTDQSSSPKMLQCHV